MSAKRQVAESARLETRIPPHQKALIQEAADLEGRTLTDFIVDSATTAARDTIERHKVLRLSERATEAFFAAIENPPSPNETLQAAARRYRAFQSR